MYIYIYKHRAAKNPPASAVIGQQVCAFEVVFFFVARAIITTTAPGLVLEMYYRIGDLVFFFSTRLGKLYEIVG